MRASIPSQNADSFSFIALAVFLEALIQTASALGRSMRLRKLAMLLSSLRAHPCLDVELEQYSTDGDLAARWLMDIAAFGDLNSDSIVADLGAGNGILGIGALALGASHCLFVEADAAACGIIQSNIDEHNFNDLSSLKTAQIGRDEIDFSGANLIISNPPWGKQKPKADRPFFDAIIASKNVAHILHSAAAQHIEPYFVSAGWSAEKYGEADFALPANYAHHSRQRDKTKVAFWRLTPN